MSKFKVGYRVRVKDTDYTGEFLSNGNKGTVAVDYDNDLYGVVSDADPDKHPYAFFDHQIELAPLFAVGDKVRWLGKFNASMYTKGKVYEIKKTMYDDSFGLTDDKDNVEAGNHQWPTEDLADHFEHATTDEEADYVAVDGTRVSSITAGLLRPTTGFTIPTDEEALPPKVANVVSEITVKLRADTAEYEASLDRILRKLKRARNLSVQLGIPLKEAA